MIDAVILLVMEAEEERRLVLVIQSHCSIVKVTVHKKAIDFLCKQARVEDVGELAGKRVVLDADADFSGIYVVIKKKGKTERLVPVPCDISLIKNLKKHKPF